MADVGEVPGHAVHSSGVLWLWCGSLPAAGILATVGAAYGGRCISIQSHDILDEPRVKLMPRVVGRMKCDRSTPAVDRHDFGMIDRESRPVHHDELERPERLPANLLRELVQGHFPPPSRLRNSSSNSRPAVFALKTRLF